MKQDSSFSYFVFLWLHPPQRGRHWNWREAAATRLDEGARVRELGPRHSWVGKLDARHDPSLHALLFQEFYEEGKEKRDSWGRDSWRILLFRHVAEEKLEWWRSGLVGGWVEGGRME